MALLSWPMGGEEWKESHAKLGGKKQELCRQIEQSWGFEELRGKLGDLRKIKSG